jgi:hypothetical protein
VLDPIRNVAPLIEPTHPRRPQRREMQPMLVIRIQPIKAAELTDFLGYLAYHKFEEIKGEPFVFVMKDRQRFARGNAAREPVLAITF